MTIKACPKCQLISYGPVCPNCKTGNLSDDFSGLAIIVNPEESAIANALKVSKKGRYALRVR